MAEPLKNQFGADIPRRIAGMVAAVHPDFDTGAFLRDALAGYEALELMPRGRHIAAALRRHLPADYEAALAVLLASVAQAPVRIEGGSLASFLFLPHTCFVATYGLDHFEASMQAQHLLTQRFTAEFSIRPFLERHPEAALARLAEWAADPQESVRRLVSEGTRPRLPWAPRLRAFQRDPRPVLALLERLKDDPSASVRRSVANNLNDIGKDHPDRLVETARRWWVDASDERRRLVRHALRSAVKRADPGALALLGVGEPAQVHVDAVFLTPARARLGGSVNVAFRLTNTGTRPQRLLVDLRIHFVKANGQTRPKVFKIKTVELVPGAAVSLVKTVSLADLTTRRHHPGRHAVEALVNGETLPLDAFELLPA
jgi:3-methyladenine DNA glycosylase AlkC